MPGDKENRGRTIKWQEKTSLAATPETLENQYCKIYMKSLVKASKIKRSMRVFGTLHGHPFPAKCRWQEKTAPDLMVLVLPRQALSMLYDFG